MLSKFTTKKSFIESGAFLLQDQVAYSKHSIFFVTYESAQSARLFYNTKLERLTSAKHFKLLSPFNKLSYEENVVL